MAFRKKTILIVDDEESIRLIASQYLTFAGFRTVTANNHGEAMELAQKEPVRLILADVMMPGKSGFDLLRDLRHHPATRHIPVVIVTALRTAADAETARISGAADVLVKPVDGRELQSLAKRLLGTALEEVD
ncbi:MAG: response regulator [Bacteroidetes bacterium]|jgi:twitching motility two-component system response regulator PilH|nr:response regulator [Bacteroidota bacterium]